MQAENKKTGKIVSLQKNLEWSTKEVLEGGISRDWKELGELWGDGGLEKYIVVNVSGLRHLLFSVAWGVGESVSGDVGLGGEFLTLPQAALPGMAPFPFPESHAIYTEKEQKTMAGGSK